MGRSGRTERIDSLTDDQLGRAELRQRVVLPLANKATLTTAEVREASETLGLSLRMTWLLIRRHRLGETNTFAPSRPGPQAGSTRLNRAVDDIVGAAINRRFATRQKPRLRSVWRDICLTCRSKGLRPPSMSTVLRRVRAMSPAVLLRAREGALAAHGLTATAGEAMPATHPLHVVQMDHTTVDVILVDGVHRRPIGRPWLTVGIDLFSRCIAGYCLSLDPPSSVSVGLCLAHIADAGKPWPLAGKPRVLHTDNAKEFRSLALRRGCVTHGIELVHRPVGRPWYGGTVERVIGTLMGKVHDTLPGTTFGSTGQRGAYPSDAKACLTLSEFESWLGEAIAEYHATLHEGLGERPMDRLAALGLETCEPPAVANLRAYTIDFLPIVRRSLQRSGFTIDHVTYYDPKLDPLIMRRHQHRHGYELRRDPRNLRFVWLRDPESGAYMELPYRRLMNPDVTLWEHREALRVLRERAITRIDEDLIFRTILAQRRIVDHAVKASRKARRHAERRASTPGQPTAPDRSVPLANASPPVVVEPFDDLDVG
jgi:putative transposase